MKTLALTLLLAALSPLALRTPTTTANHPSKPTAPAVRTAPQETQVAGYYWYRYRYRYRYYRYRYYQPRYYRYYYYRIVSEVPVATGVTATV